MKISQHDYLIYVFSLLVALFIIHFSYGLSIINPNNINWIMSVHHDWGTHYLGWAFYRYDPWTFPLGYTSSYNYPLGTNVGFTDTIPLLAFIFKPFSSILPDDFQYFGIWLFVCHFLTAVFTFKIFDLFKVNKWITLFAVILLAANPVLLIRCIHPALSAHFLIVASIYNYLKPSDYKSSRSININQIFLFFLAGTVNPYISVMIFGFNFILPLKHYFIDKSISIKKIILYPIISISAVMIFWIVFGMVELNNSTNLASAESFNFFSFNLNSFFNSYGYYSKFFPDFGRKDDRQYEGFAYLGIGIMIIIFISTIFVFSKVYQKKLSITKFYKYILLFILCIAFFLFAITNEVTYGTNTILTLPLPSLIQKLGFIFRASGRFVWPLYYSVLIFSILILTKIKINPKILICLLFTLTSLQLYDIQNLFSQWNLPSGNYYSPLSDKKWISVIEKFKNVIIYPPFTYNYSMTYNMDYQDVCFLALKAKKPISNGYVARTNIKNSEEFRTKIIEKLNRGEIEDNRLFITTPEHIGNFDVLIKKKLAIVQKMNKFIFIYSSKKQNITSNFFDNTSQTKSYIDSINTYYQNHKIIEFTSFNSAIKEENKIEFYIDNFKYNNNMIQLRGWAFLKETNNNKKDSLFLSLTNNNKTIVIPLKVDKRPDITATFKKEYLDNAGFYSAISTAGLQKNNYQIGILIKNLDKKYSYVNTNRLITVK
jgi:Family of unknown function (DUF6311)